MANRSLFFLALFCLALHAEIVVVTSERSTLQALTKNEVRQLFLTNQRSGAVAVESISNPLHKGFYTDIAGKTEAQLRAYRARQIFSGRGNPPKRINGDDLPAYLDAHPEAVTYMEASGSPSSLKVLYRLP